MLPHMPDDTEKPLAAHPGAENSSGQRVIGRPWPKGVSGNPGGRPKTVQRLKALLEPHLDEIAAKVIEQAKAGDLPALKEYLDRLVGKPTVGEPDDEGRQAGSLTLRWKKEGEPE